MFRKQHAIHYLMRFFHFAILLFLTNSLANSKAYRQQCTDLGRTYSLVYNNLALLMILVNIVSICYINHKEDETHVEAIVSLVVNGVCVSLLVYLTFRAILPTSSYQCRQIDFIQRQTLFSAFRIIFMQFLLFFACDVNWAQRYTSSPGNIIWAFMFIFQGYGMDTEVNWVFRAIGYMELAICIGSVIINIVPLFIQTGQKYDKIFRYWWLTCISSMVILEITILLLFGLHNFNPSRASHESKRMMQIFLSCNLVDILFWLWGYLVTYDQKISG